MIKRGITPSHQPYAQQSSKYAPRRMIGKELKNVIYAYHNKISQSGSKSVNKLLIQDNQESKKTKVGCRNNSLKIIKQNESKGHTGKDGQIIHDDKDISSAKQQRSLGESTTASPKSVSIKDYLKSKAPLAISEISSELKIITPEMRQLVITWIIEVSHKIPLKSETLFHCVLIFDYILANYKSTNASGMSICLENLQLVALACLFISAKYEQIYAPTADHIIKVADYSYSKKKLIQVQATILLEQSFNLTFPTRFTFLQQMINDQQGLSSSKSKRIQHMALFLLQMSLLQMWDDASEEQLAQAALFLAKRVGGIIAEIPNRKICQHTWKLMQSWKQRRNSILCFIFDADKYSFVGGVYLQQI